MGHRGIGRPTHRVRNDRGAVTAELAIGLPVLLAVTLGLVWLLAIGAAQVQVIDASREAARAIARGDDQATAEAVAERIAPSSATVSVTVTGDRVEVVTAARVKGPGGLFSHLRTVQVRSAAVALVEE